jgi:hypothetical protein
MKTFFWTSVVWMLALAAFWCAGEWTLEGRDFWIQVIPTQVKASLANPEQAISETQEENNQEDQLSALFSGENENTTGENLTGALSANAEEAELTGEKVSEPEFIVEIASDKNEKSDSEEALITKNNNQKEIAALQARVEALEYHLLMLMQSLKQPQTQPTGIPMKYPVWNYNLQN